MYDTPKLRSDHIGSDVAHVRDAINSQHEYARPPSPHTDGVQVCVRACIASVACIGFVTRGLSFGLRVPTPPYLHPTTLRKAGSSAMYLSASDIPSKVWRKKATLIRFLRFAIPTGLRLTLVLLSTIYIYSSSVQFGPLRLAAPGCG